MQWLNEWMKEMFSNVIFSLENAARYIYYNLMNLSKKKQKAKDI